MKTMVKLRTIRQTASLLLVCLLMLGLMLPVSAAQTTVLTAVTAITGSQYDQQTPVFLIDGSGMSGDGIDATHDNNGNAFTMWHTNANPAENAWVQIDLGQAFAIDEMYVWNMNQANNTARGLKNIKIQYTPDGIVWYDLAPADGMTFEDGNADYPFQLAKASGEDGIAATNLNDGNNTPISFGGAKARYIKISAAPTAGDGSWGDVYFGLSEVRFTTTVSDDTILAESIAVNSESGAAAITENGGSLQMQATVSPENATVKEVAWNVIGADGRATNLAVISETGLLSARANGTVTVIAAAKDGSGISGRMTVEISGQPVIITGVTATAGDSYSNRPGAKTVDHSGMSGTLSIWDTHDNHPHGETMWHTNANPGANAWVEYDLGEVKAIEAMYVWNMNQANNTTRGLKEIKIEYKANEADAWTELRGADAGEGDYPYTLAQADGSAQLSATNLVGGAPVQFGVEARYVRITAGSSYGDVYWGLSEVRFTEQPADYSDLLTIDISDGVVSSADIAGKQNITWNANVRWAEETGLEEINALATFTEYGVIYGTSKEAVAAAAAGEETTQAKVKAFAKADDIDVYTIFGFRLKNVAKDATRVAMFYVTYEVEGRSYTVYSSAVSAQAVVD